MSDASIKLIGAIFIAWIYAGLTAAGAYRTDRIFYYPKLSVTLPPLISFLLFLYPRRKKIPIASIVLAVMSIIALMIFVVYNIISLQIPDRLCNILKYILLCGLPVCALAIFIDDRINYPDIKDNMSNIEDYINNPDLYHKYSSRTKLNYLRRSDKRFQKRKHNKHKRRRSGD